MLRAIVHRYRDREGELRRAVGLKLQYCGDLATHPEPLDQLNRVLTGVEAHETSRRLRRLFCKHKERAEAGSCTIRSLSCYCLGT
ncbi:hypothetical protein GCM10022288_25060 [Gryllotalpicola kribbensis]|uniref:Transposase n=1 Tax=Gryllotalpicola kribbensis TaxID=993084 RepID=A0ABP8AWX6_9MICO